MAEAADLSPYPGRLTDPLRRRRPAHPWVWAGLVVLMLLAQTLGQWHGLAHPHAPKPAAGSALRQAQVQAHAHAHDATNDHAARGSWLLQLFDADEHAASCVLYDQLAHADGLPSVPMLWLPPAWVPAVPPWQACWQLAAQAAGFLARGPPLRA